MHARPHGFAASQKLGAYAMMPIPYQETMLIVQYGDGSVLSRRAEVERADALSYYPRFDSVFFQLVDVLIEVFFRLDVQQPHPERLLRGDPTVLPAAHDG